MEEDFIRKVVEAERIRLAGSALMFILRVESGPWVEADLAREVLGKADFGIKAVQTAIYNFRAANALVLNPPDQLLFNEDAVSNL